MSRIIYYPGHLKTLFPFILHVGWFAWMFLYCTCLHCPKRSQERIISFATGVTEGCEPPFGRVDCNLGTLQEQSYSEIFIKWSEEFVQWHIICTLNYALQNSPWSEVALYCQQRLSFLMGAAFIKHLINEHLYFCTCTPKYFWFLTMWKDAHVYVYVTSFIQGSHFIWNIVVI